MKLFQHLDLAIPNSTAPISEDEFNTPLPAPRSRPRSRISPQLLIQQQQQQSQTGSQELFLLSTEVKANIFININETRNDQHACANYTDLLLHQLGPISVLYRCVRKAIPYF